MKSGPRLRWQLTLSHLAAVAVTLVSMVGALALLVALVFASRGSPRDQTVNDARTVAISLSGLVNQGDPSQINRALQVETNPGFRFPMPIMGPPSGRRTRFGGWGIPIQNVSYIAFLGPNGEEQASSDPVGASFSPPERGEWLGAAAKALAGDTSTGALVTPRSGPGPAALVAYPVEDENGHPAGAVVLGLSALPPTGRGGIGFSQALAFFGAASLALLGAASVFAFGSSSLVAYLLSRRVVRRLERLGHAAEAIANGDLQARVFDPANDELGQLAGRFDQMARDLQRSLTQLTEERDRVTGLLKARRELVANVSHELRTPVAIVRGYLEAALRDPDQLPEGLRGDLETIDGEVRRLQHLIEDLFTLSRAELGRLELRLQPTDVGQLVARGVDTIAPLAWTQWRVQVTSEISAEPALARADPERFQQVLSNLLNNAIRHTPPGGLVAASLAAEDGQVRLDVRDTGAGIAHGDLPHVFERFYRGSGEAGNDGAGLGLAVAKELVETMGGSIQAESVAGEGSCFTIRLPRA